MANRMIVSPIEVPYSSDVLRTNKFAYVGSGRLTDAILGNTDQLNGMACTPTAPASLAVNIGSGEIYILEPTDPIAYGVLPIDNRNIMKQGILEDTIELSTPAPAGVGNSVKYLIQVAFSEIDNDPVLRQFYNSSNPSSPTFQTVNTQRTDSAVVQAKSGTPAPTGTETAPLPDAGFVGAYVITVANGQTTVTSGNIVVYTGAPFITDKLKDKISETQGDARYAQLSQFQASATGNGYTHLPNGLLAQWGVTGVFPNTGIPKALLSQNFPIPFPNEVFTIVTSGSGDADALGTTCVVRASATLTTANFDAVAIAGTGFTASTFIVRWFAMGN